MAKPQLLLLTFDYRPKKGGISTYAHELALALHRKNPGDVLVVAPAAPGAEPDLVPTVRVSLPRSTFLAALVFCWHLTRLWFRHPEARVLCTNWNPAGLATWLSPARWGRSYFISAHGAELLERKAKTPGLAWVRRFLRARILSAAEAVLPVSHYTAGKVVAACRKNLPSITLVPNGVNTDLFFPEISAASIFPRSHLPLVVSVCRLEPHKGIDTALYALAHARDLGRPYDYAVAGSGRDETRLRALTKELNLEAYVHFFPNLDDAGLRALYNACDLFLLLSREIPETGAVEGFGLVFLEAAACGKTAVSSRTGGIPDAVLHEETGLLVESSNPVAAAESILRLLEDVSLRQRLSAAAFERVRTELNWPQVAERIGEITHG